MTVIRDRDGTISTAKCSLCDTSITRSPLEGYDEGVAREAIATFTTLITLPEFNDSKRPRVLGMFALRSFARHYNDSSLMNIETSVLGHWCLTSLRSSMRELRIAAGYVSPPLSFSST
jgi:serine/threonine-protein kinase ATR